MTQQLNAMQESIKIALDAADAATDVTSEYKRIKNEYLKAEQKVKEIHKYTTIVFSSSIATAVIAIILTGLLYFKSLSELEEMTGTSKEALVVFAENVENVNKAVDDMNSSLSKHTDLVNANEQIQTALDNLSNAIKANDKKPTIVEMQTTKGNLTIMLYDKTPLHKENFLKLIKNDFYKGISFHRVIMALWLKLAIQIQEIQSLVET